MSTKFSSGFLGWGLIAGGVIALGVALAPDLIGMTRSGDNVLAWESDTPAQDRGSRGDAPSLEGSRPLQYSALEPDWLSGGDDAGLPTNKNSGAGAVGSENLACIVEPNRIVDIGSPVKGLIQDIPVERADIIEKGQTLVLLESNVEQAAVALARKRAAMNEALLVGKARLELGKRKSRRMDKLFENHALSLEVRDEVATEAELARLEFNRARAEKKLAALELAKAQAVLRRRTISSPFAGVVLERLMSAGERVDQETIMRIAQIDPLRVEVILPAEMFGTIKLDGNASVVPEFPGDTVHVAKVTIVDQVVDSASGTFGVRLELPNPDHSIPGGVHCQIQFLDE